MIVKGDPTFWALAAAITIGVSAGFLVVWMITRHTRRAAREQAGQLIEVAKREAAVAAQELKQRVEEELTATRAEHNREFDRREIEVEVKLREIRAHEESLGLLDYQLEQKSERLRVKTPP